MVSLSRSIDDTLFPILYERFCNNNGAANEGMELMFPFCFVRVGPGREAALGERLQRKARWAPSLAFGKA